MQDKFILERKRKYVQTDRSPKIHVSQKTYSTLASWAEQTGIPLSSIVDRTVQFAEDHLVLIDE